MVRPFLQEEAEGKYWYGWEEVGYIIGSFTTLNLGGNRPKSKEAGGDVLVNVKRGDGY
jgi:hypothetical protein